MQPELRLAISGCSFGGSFCHYLMPKNSGSTEDSWVEVARVDDVPAGAVRGARANGRMLALVNVDGKIYALDGVCPHMKGPLWQGDVWRGQLECPWHHYRYDPATGRNTYPANVYPEDMPQLQPDVASVKTYKVRVDDGKIFVKL